MVTINEKCSDLIIHSLTVDQLISLSFADYNYYCNDKKAFLDIIRHCVDTTKINLDETNNVTKLLLQILNISFYPDAITNATFLQTFNTIYAKKDKSVDDVALLTKFYNLFRYDFSTLLNSRYELSALSSMSLTDVGNMNFFDFLNSRTYHNATVVITRKVTLSDFNNGYHPVFKTWYDLLTVKPSTNLAKDLNNLIISLNNQGQLSKLDLFHPIAGMETNEQRLTPIVTTGLTPFVISGTIEFTSNGATRAAATTSYIDLKWNPFTNGVNHTLNNASLGVYSMTDADENSYDIGSYDKNSDIALFIKSNFSKYLDCHINQSISSIVHTIENPNSLGLHSAVRTNSTEIQSYKNGSLLETGSAPSISIPNYNMFLLAANGNGIATNYSSRTIALLYAGSGSINQTILNSSINNYMVSRGLI